MLEPEDELRWELLKRRIPEMTRDSLEKKYSDLIDYHVSQYQKFLERQKQQEEEVKILKAKIKQVESFFAQLGFKNEE